MQDMFVRKARGADVLSSRIADSIAQRLQRQAEEAEAETIDATGTAAASNERVSRSGTTVYTTDEISNSFSAQSSAASANMDPALVNLLVAELGKFKEIMQQEVEVRVETVRGEMLQQLTAYATSPLSPLSHLSLSLSSLSPLSLLSLSPLSLSHPPLSVPFLDRNRICSPQSSAGWPSRSPLVTPASSSWKPRSSA